MSSPNTIINKICQYFTQLVKSRLKPVRFKTAFTLKEYIKYNNPKNPIMKIQKISSIVVVALAMIAGTTSFAQEAKMSKEKPVIVGGREMYPTKNIVENASQSKDHTTLVAAVKAAGLVETLSDKGPFTVFAPTNQSFADLPEGTVETLLKPENNASLQGILTYHVIAGKVNAADVIALVKENDGSATVQTVAGGSLIFTVEDGDVYVEDENGGSAVVTIADVNQSNGVVHVIDAVLLPKSK